MKGMPPVAGCDVNECFYNREKNCHAPAINVGGDHPLCDTFVSQSGHIGRSDTGMVGACHVRDCRYNSDMTCSAQAIQVGHHTGHADCVTFAPR